MSANCAKFFRLTFILVVILNVQESSVSSSESLIRAMWTNEIFLASVSSFVTRTREKN